MNKKILFGIPPKDHVILALDEMQGLTEMGFDCRSVTYGRNNPKVNKSNKFIVVVINAFKVVFSLYKFSPDILYLNSRFEPIASTRDFFSILIIKFLYFKNLKIFIKTHGSDISLLLKTSFFYKKIVVPFLVKFVDGWFFLSNEERENIANYNPRLAGNFFLTANIIDPSRSVKSMLFQKRYKLEGDKIKFLFIGRMIKEKGIFSILKSIPYLEFKEKCIFIFVGDGPDLNELKSLSEKLSITQYVRFLGFIPEEESDHFYANADVLVFPTFFNEGFPMALFKSVVAGLPVITTNIRAAKDHLTSPENALWVNGKSELSVARAISDLYENTERRTLMSHNNKKLGMRFSRKNVCENMYKVLNNI